MAKKSSASVGGTQPKFTYTNVPSALRKLLKEIPKRPLPSGLTLETLRAWNVSSDSNAQTAIKVLKRIGMLSDSGSPLSPYVEFMKPMTGPKALATLLKTAYAPLFENAHNPQDAAPEELRSLFNIHSGGSGKVMDLQIQTFKALCEHADFSSTGTSNAVTGSAPTIGAPPGEASTGAAPPVRIDLHIHLPENKTVREYEAIIQDIGKYIYGRSAGD